MAILEYLTMHVGVSVSKSIFKIWTKDSPVLQEAGSGIFDLVASKIGGFTERRDVTRQFEAVADQVAKKLEPLIAAEFRDLPENEINAAIIAVGNAIENTPLDLTNILSKDLDPIAIEKSINDNNNIKESLLVRESADLYRVMIRESCNYMVEVAVTMPNFTGKSIAEILNRETEIISLVKDVLNRMPDVSDDALIDGGEDIDFERQYRRSLARKLDWLELYGIDLDPAHMRYALSVGYITLTTSKSHTSVDAFDLDADEISMDGVPRGGDDDEYVDVETALSNENRVLIRGEAGSGKTTLLQWLAVRGANNDFEGVLEGWNGVIPFFIQLRRFVDSGLPTPEKFLDNVVPNVVEIMPSGWVHRCLSNGLGLVLIDGVDELPEGMRAGARKWLEDLAGEFPEARFIVTSRPPAVSGDWLSALKFAHCELQSLTPGDIDKFIDHWHMAAYGTIEIDTHKNDESERLRKNLKQVIRDNRPIRSLATSPLLCAMLCALNRDRREQIPQDRMSLYKVALEMLLERRDAARNIEIDEIDPPSLVEKKLLLQNFSYWLIVNGYSDASRGKAEAVFSKKLVSMVGVNCSGSDIYNYLLLRSGIIREAVEGRVDFIHRTFQEFLAADEAVHQHCIGQLVENAHRDQWKEVIVLACGHARKDERELLINGILDRGDAEPRNRHLLHLLAITCLETSPELDPEVISKLELRLKKLVPPRSMTEARALASAGELAIPMMETLGRQNVRIQAACIRTLALIGGDKAFDLIKRSKNDDRVTVTRELIRSWNYFDLEDYSKEILCDSGLDYGAITVKNMDQLECVPNLKNIRHLSAEFFGVIKSLNPIGLLKGLNTLILYGGFTNNLGDLKDDSYTPISQCSNLRQVTLVGCPGLSNICFLSNLKKLETLNLAYCRDIRSLQSIGKLKSLAHLQLDGLSDVAGIGEIRDLDNLKTLQIGRVYGELTLPNLSNLQKLRHVSLFQTKPVLSFLEGTESVTKLTLYPGREGCRLEEMEGLVNLQNLEINSPYIFKDLRPLLKLKNLKSLVIRADKDDVVIRELEDKGVKVNARQRMYQRYG